MYLCINVTFYATVQVLACRLMHPSYIISDSHYIIMNMIINLLKLKAAHTENL